MSGLDYIGSKSDPLASLLFCGASHRTKYTVVNGRIAVKDGRLALEDERRVTARATRAAAALYRRAGLK